MNYRQNINDISLTDYQLHILIVMLPNIGYDIYFHILLKGVQKWCKVMNSSLENLKKCTRISFIPVVLLV